MALSIDTKELLKIAQQGVEDSKLSSAAGAGKLKAPNAKVDASEKWEVPQLDTGFELEPALEKAYLKASTYMNKLLMPEDLAVDLQTQGEDTIVRAKDLLDGRIVKTWPGSDMLKLYARNIKPLGVIVDGEL